MPKLFSLYFYEMKKLYLALFILLFLSACYPELITPKFQGFEKIIVTDLSSNKVNIEADAIVYNPNPFSIYLNSIELDVYANQTLVSHISQTKQSEIAKHADFQIPLSASFNPTSLFKDNLMDLFGAAINAYYNQQIDLEFKGFAQFELKGISFDVPISYRDEILLKEE